MHNGKRIYVVASVCSYRAWQEPCRRTGANLQEACAKGNPFKELVEGEGCQKRADNAGVAGHAQGHANEHRVDSNPSLQHLHPKLQAVSCWG